jgi:hypothetical protein
MRFDMKKNARVPVSKKIRFEVFKRDSFTCQYCGAKAPEVVLNVDHINPVSKGGDNSLMNLITACFGCNAGKKDIQLSDQSVLAKQQAMIEELNLRREQLEMMLKWRDELSKLDSEIQEFAINRWQSLTPGFSLNETGKKKLRLIFRKHGLDALLNAMERASELYFEYDENDELTSESVNHAFSKIPGVLRTLSLPEQDRQLLYIRGICRNRFSYCDESQCLSLLKATAEAGYDVETLTDVARASRNWSQWRDSMYELLDEAIDGKGKEH